MTGTATSKQLELANNVSLVIPKNTPKLVAAAMLRQRLFDELQLPPTQSVSENLVDRIKALRKKTDPLIQPKTNAEASAWISHLYLVRRKERMMALKLNSGDLVRMDSGETVEVSSIGLDGRVYLKGGHGFSSWPDLLKVCARKGKNSRLHKFAQNAASLRCSTAAWSEAKNIDLKEFAPVGALSENDIIELETVISRAKDERPIQKHFERNPHLLTALLGGSFRYCLPQKRLGGEYVPDFIIGDVNSLGVRWVLVELETPRSGIYLKNGQELDAKARKGVGQIVTWRNWLSSNIAYARQPKAQDGLGLYDIREKSNAIVLVGRRSQMPQTTDAQRLEYRQSSNIEIHTYDWLVEQLRGVLGHDGVPANVLVHRELDKRPVLLRDSGHIPSLRLL